MIMSRAITPELLKWCYDIELLERLIEIDENPRNRALVSLLATSFIRTTQTINIKLSNVNYEIQALSIDNPRAYVKISCSICGEKLAKKFRFCPGCGCKVIPTPYDKSDERRQRLIPINQNTLNQIEKYIEWRRRFSYQGPSLFPLTRQRVWQLIERLGRRMGIKELHPESLRHLLAARWINKGLDPRILKFLMSYSGALTYPPPFTFERIKAEYLKLWQP
jgi:site-specific recombinase XerD